MPSDMYGFPGTRRKPPVYDYSPGQPGEWAFDSRYFYMCTAPNTWARSALVQWSHVYTYVSDGDANGLFYALGVLAGAGTWTNPHTAGQITIDATPGFSGSAYNVVARAPSNEYCGQAAGNWWWVDVGTGSATRLFVPSYYSYQQRNSAGNFMTQMKLQGSNDNIGWFDITTADSPTATISTWTSFPCAGSIGYRYFRLLRTALDSSGQQFFTIGQWEMYGSLIAS